MISDDGQLVERIVLVHDRDVALARSAVGRAMDELGARGIRRTRFVTAVSEIARNAVLHGGRAEICVRVRHRPPQVSVICRDDGPGIANVEQAMIDGFTTKNGLGRGLGGARRLSDSFEIDSCLGLGTTVRMSVSL